MGWLGTAYSLPEGAKFDDYLVLVPEEAGSFGIIGVHERVEAQIVALRDHPEPGKFANFWGRLNCDVPDYNGCQIQVNKLQVEGVEIIVSSK